MITSAFILLAGSIMALILGILYPFRGSNGFPDEIDTYVTLFASYVKRTDTFVSLTAVNSLVSFIILFEIATLTFYVIRWLVGFLPQVGGR